MNYADNTDNGDALEKLTGYKAGDDGGPITPDPAFNELRAARDESGADLVSLVRAFQHAGEQWLRHCLADRWRPERHHRRPMRRSVIPSSAMASISTRATATPISAATKPLPTSSATTWARRTTWKTATATGVHAYSYGYREASSTGFYTVMAYPQADGNQFVDPLFRQSERSSTAVAPRASPTQSDNVRSMNQTMPIVSQFRATVSSAQRYGAQRCRRAMESPISCSTTEVATVQLSDHGRKESCRARP